MNLIELARRLGRPQEGLCLFAEGNCSELLDDGSLRVKATGKQMAEANDASFVRVSMAPILELVQGSELPSEADVRQRLDDAVLEPIGGKASTETFFHAVLLADSQWRFVAHTHARHVLALCCRPDGADEAIKRYFPDEIVLTGVASGWVDYCAPGLPLARALAQEKVRHQERWGEAPKCWWLGNHGLICLGRTASEAFAATLMSEKAAQVRLLAGPNATALTASAAAQIAGWSDETYRQRLLFDPSS